MTKPLPLFPDDGRPETAYQRHRRECAQTARMFPPAPAQAQTPPGNGQAERDAAIAQVAEGADPEWLERADEALVALAPGCRFTTDRLWDDLGEPSLETTRERRAMGVVIRRAHQRGLIVPTPHYQDSARPICHRNPKRVWIRR